MEVRIKAKTPFPSSCLSSPTFFFLVFFKNQAYHMYGMKLVILCFQSSAQSTHISYKNLHTSKGGTAVIIHREELQAWS